MICVQIMDKIRVKNLFAAVSNKSILDPLLEILGAGQAKGQAFAKESPKLRTGLSSASNIRFWGTEGTAKYLKSKGFDAQSVVSGFDFNGRVKSLDKKVFVAILADPAKQDHIKELTRLGVEPLNAVIVDLYPLDKNNFPESMDIGGQALIRAAIKNYKNVSLAFDTSSLAGLVDELISNAGSTTLLFRKTQAQKAAKFIAKRSDIESGTLG